MARPENMANQGYVPTPDGVIDHLAKWLLVDCSCESHTRFNKAKRFDSCLNILDPCCGEGTAVLELADRLFEKVVHSCEIFGDKSKFHRIRTWGVEINVDRAKEASTKLFRVHNMDFLSDSVVVPDSFQVAYVNPPYDEIGNGEGRIETLFLARAAEALMPGGILIYVVPDHVADGDKQIISQHFANPVKVRFPVDDFKAYRQVVVIAHKREMPIGWNDAATRRWQNEGAINSLDDFRKSPFGFWLDEDNSKVSGALVRLRDTYLDKLEEEMLKTSAWVSNKVQQTFDANLEMKHRAPLSPLRKGHLIIQIANGQLNNAELVDPTGVKPPMIVRGSAHKIQEQEYESEDGTKLVMKDKVTTVLQTMNTETGYVQEIDEGSGSALTDFLMDNWPALEEYAKVAFKPTIDPTEPKYQAIRKTIRAMKRPPLSYQFPVAVTLAAAIKTRKTNYLIGEQGTGKTYISMVAALAAGCRKILITTPSHAIETWVEEIRETVPNARIRVVTGIGDGVRPLTNVEINGEYTEMGLARIRLLDAGIKPEQNPRPIFVLLSKDKARNGHPTHILKRMVSLKEGDKRLFRHGGELAITEGLFADATCPFCWTMPEAVRGFKYHNVVRCPNPMCREQLYQPDTDEIHVGDPEAKAVRNARRYAPGDYMVKQMSWWPDIYIADEVHQYKAKDSAQGDVCGRIAQVVKRALAMTGTFMGGKASEMFYLFHRFGTDFSPDFEWSDESGFVEKYGRYRYTHNSKDGQSLRVGTHSRRRSGKTVDKSEIVGYHPEVMRYILPNAVFIRREDIIPEKKLEPAEHCSRCEEEFVYGFDGLCWRCRMNPRFENIMVEMDDTYKHDVIMEDEDGQTRMELTQKAAYKILEQVHYQVAKDCLAEHNSIAGYAELRQNLMTYPENCWQGAIVHRPLTPGKPIIFEIGPTDETFQYPKEKKLLEIILKEKAEGRKCLVYCTHTVIRSTVERVEKLLKEHGVITEIMRIKEPRERLEWLRQVSKTADVVIVNPKSVETGLNLQEYPTMVWYEINESMYVTDQASARSARVNQKQEVRVYFMAYQETIQQVMLTLIATKSDMARRIYGELGSTGLSALNPEDTDLKQVLERKLYDVLKNTESKTLDWGDLMGSEIDINAGFSPGKSNGGETFVTFDMPDDDLAVPVPALAKVGSSLAVGEVKTDLQTSPSEPGAVALDSISVEEQGTAKKQLEPEPEPAKQGILARLGKKQQEEVNKGQMAMF